VIVSHIYTLLEGYWCDVFPDVNYTNEDRREDRSRDAKKKKQNKYSLDSYVIALLLGDFKAKLGK